MTTTIHEGAPLRPHATHATTAPDVRRFIDTFREEGHRHAALDPLGLSQPLDAQALAPARFGLSAAEPQTAALVQRLKAAYCGTLALDASAVRDEARRQWLFARMEAPGADAPADTGTELLDRLIQVQAWEQHVAQRFPHAKRFSLEGCEALLPLLDALVEEAAAHGIGAVTMGMPHRGRVNVLVNLLGMAPSEAMAYFDPQASHPELQSDLVYHLGGRRTLATRHGEVALELAPNPSHLQSVYPVVTGMARAAGSLALVLHGDAAFAGQGVVMETLMLTQKPGYSVGGTVHVIINNQLGFTEPNRMDALAQRYCTDATRMIDAPVLRVNAEAPEQLARAAAIALDWREAFGTDIVIDLIGYRRLGHSEHDVPALTSPLVYPRAERQPSVVETFAASLVRAGQGTAAALREHVARGREAAFQAFEASAVAAPPAMAAQPPAAVADAPLTRERLQRAVEEMTCLPDGFQPHRLVQSLRQHWAHAVRDGQSHVDWCFAENMAYATTLQAGIDVRVSGLDVQRGTFMHRHAVWHDQSGADGEGRAHVPLQHVEAEGDGAAAGRFEVVNSVLSEEAVLGYEYGHSVQDTRGLTVWEAQFGDFVNGAQVYVDQYLSAGEEKWGRRSALAVLLPHGYEGVGPEHSNAFLARFLQLCGNDNLRVACPSTSAQWFHLLRRQAFDAQRKPLVVMTPKGVLYGEAASHSALHELLDGAFQPLLDDAHALRPEAVHRVVVCSGKLYYDLHAARMAAGREDVALLRAEQLYPFPAEALRHALARYPALRTLVWAQEETRNQGAWSFVRDDLADACPAGAVLKEVSRSVTAAGATSSHTVHQRQQRELVAKVLGDA